MEPYLYTGNNPIMFTDPTGMVKEGADGPPDPPVKKQMPASTRGALNVAGKYLSAGMSAIADPVGAVKSTLKSIGEEGNDFINQDGGNIGNTILRKGREAFDSYSSRVKNSNDPIYEHNVIMSEIATEVIGGALVGEGVGALVGRGLGATGTSLGGMIDDVARFGSKSEGLGHFTKHGSSVKNALGRSKYNFGDYLTDANYVIKNGTYVPEMNGYVRLIGGKGSAKFGFVGLNRQTGNITTFHIKTAKELSKSAPKTFKY